MGIAPGALDEEFIDYLEAYCVQEKIEYVVIDTYGSASPSGIDRNTAAYSDGLKRLGHVSDNRGILFVTLLHHRKSIKNQRGGIEMIDGHNSIGGALQGAITLHRPVESDKTLIDVSCTRAYEDSFPDFQFRWVDVSPAGEIVTSLGKLAPGLGLRADIVTDSAVKSDEPNELRIAREIVESAAGITDPYGVNEKMLLAPVRGKTEEKRAVLQGLCRAGVVRTTPSGNGVRYLGSKK